MYGQSVIAGAVVFLLILQTYDLIPGAWAENIIPNLYPSDSKPYGVTFPQWSENWWQWLVSVPDPTNPLKDATGKDCGVNQYDHNVWFLVGFSSGTVVRSCTIPFGKSILLQAVGTECSFAEFPSLKSGEDLRNCAVSGDQVSSIHVTIDGTSVPNLQNFIVLTPLFNLTFPNNNIFGAPAGKTQSISHAYLFFWKPLSIGNHDIHFNQVTLGSPQTGTQSYAYDVEYHITVK